MQVWYWVPTESAQEFKNYAESMTEGGRKELYTKSISPFLQDVFESPPEPTLPLRVGGWARGGVVGGGCCLVRGARVLSAPMSPNCRGECARRAALHGLAHCWLHAAISCHGSMCGGPPLTAHTAHSTVGSPPPP